MVIPNNGIGLPIICIVSPDSRGIIQIRVYVEGALVSTFEFDME